MIAGDSHSAAVPQAGASAWSPFRHTAFAVLWSATLLSNIGGWMHEVGAGWLMTTMTTSPVLVALVQTATTLPVFLLALPAGALADIIDRRRLLIGAQLGMTLLAGALGALVLAGGITPLALLLFTFALGIGIALIAPAWQAIVPSLVPRSDLAAAIALNSVGINVSRAIGPALGGAVILGLGVAWPFVINALSYLIVIAALLWWRPPPAPSRVLPSEQFFAAIRTGLRYSRASDPLKHTLYRTVLFVVFASAYFALLPLITRERLDGGAELYGLLVGCIGAGAVTAAILLPRIRAALGPGRLVAASTVMTAAVLAAFALSGHVSVAVAASLMAGASWLAALSSFHVSIQMSLPDWVRARGLSIYTAVFFGALAGGSLVWGQLAARLGLSGALLVAGGGALVCLWPASRYKLHAGESLNLSPSSHWPQPLAAGDAASASGPVMVTVEYRVREADVTAFLEVVKELAKSRRRGGAFGWGIYRDAADPERFLEYFLEESWLAHLRHHERVTGDDRALQERVASFHSGPGAPLVHHYLAAGALQAQRPVPPRT